MLYISVVPIVILLISLVIFRFSTRRAGALALLSAAGIAYFTFGIPFSGLTIALCKGMALAIFVSLIVTSALFLYGFVEDVGAVDAIAGHLVHFIRDRFALFLLLAWLFSAFLQGIAGFGVPVAIVAPILVRLGFNPYLSIAAVLLGHSWSISFGSMGSSLMALSLVTSIPPDILAGWMAFFALISLVFTGLGVCFLYDKVRGLRRGLSYVVLTSFVVGAGFFLTIFFELTSLIALISSLFGILAFLAVYRLRNITPERSTQEKPAMNFAAATLPYLLIVFFSVSIPFFGKSPVLLDFHFPGYTTLLGFEVSPVESFASIKLFGHPGPVIFFCSFLSMIYYCKAGAWKIQKLRPLLGRTFDRCLPSFVSLVFLISTATVMMGCGMTERIALEMSETAGSFYPFFAPFVGILGAFMTGSNTNSNVIFGSLQQTIAEDLGIQAPIVCASQSIGGSAGCVLGPTQILLGTSSVGLQGNEQAIYRTLVLKVLLLGSLLGLTDFLLVRLFSGVS